MAACAAGVGVLTAPAGFAHADPPLAANNDSAVVVGAKASGNLLTNDRGPEDQANPRGLVSVEVSQPAHGRVTVTQIGAFTYLPDVCVTADSFTYTIHDLTNNDNKSTATVAISVPAVAVRPGAHNDSFAVKGNGQAEGNVLANDCGANIQVLVTTSPLITTHGKVFLQASGSLLYVRNPGDTKAGSDSFVYDLQNTASGLTDSASVSLSLPAIVTPPPNTGGNTPPGNTPGGNTPGNPAPQGGNVPQTGDQQAADLGGLLGSLVPRNNTNPGTRNTTGAAPRPQLPATGASHVVPTTLTGIGLVAVGAAAVAATRRRRLVEAVDGPAEAGEDTED